MTAINCNGHPVLYGTITAPNQGAWWADIQTRGALSTGDTAVITDGETTNLVGTVVDGGESGSRIHARIIGGKGGVLTNTSGRSWRQTTASKVLLDICSDISETPSPGIATSVALSSLPFWTQPVESGGSALRNLADHLGVTWRVLTNGTVWLGDSNAGEPGLPEFTVLDPHPEDRSYDVAPESLALWVGKTQQEQAVKRVEYSLGERLRCTYWL